MNHKIMLKYVIINDAQKFINYLLMFFIKLYFLYNIVMLKIFLYIYL